MHQAPREQWTVEALAERSACSRSLLAERFKAVIGEAPIHYLTRVRMHHAARLQASFRTATRGLAQATLRLLTAYRCWPVPLMQEMAYRFDACR
jgi:AraC-like DNA-binding protein